MEIDISSATLSSQSDHREDKAQSVVQIHRPDLSAVHHSVSAETPMEELNKDDGMEIDAYSEQSASNGETAHQLPNQVGIISQVDDSGPKQEVISCESNGQEASSDGIEEQENSDASHPVQINRPCTQIVNQSSADPKIKEPTPETGSGKRPSEAIEPSSKAAKRNGSNKEARRAKKARKMA